jgi:hypothetical protein
MKKKVKLSLSKHFFLVSLCFVLLDFYPNLYFLVSVMYIFYLASSTDGKI